jgi:hypothetical protein
MRQARNEHIGVSTGGLRACLKMWRQASLPAVEGGILPPGKTIRMMARSNLPVIFPVATPFRRAGSPGSTSAKMADATVFRQALSGGKTLTSTNNQERKRL